METQAKSQNQKINTEPETSCSAAAERQQIRALRSSGLSRPQPGTSPHPRPRGPAHRRATVHSEAARHGGCCRPASLPLWGDHAHTQPGPAPRFPFTPGPAGGWGIVSKDLGTVGGVSPPLPCPGYQRFSWFVIYVRAPSLVAQRVKNPAMQDTQVGPLGQEEPLEKKVATHSSILAWRIP